MLTEKYRPKSLSEVVGQEEIIAKLKKKLRKPPQQIPHFLFYGDSGVGKTTVAMAMANDLDAQYLEFNASDERGIDDIREKMIPAMSYNFLKPKIIFMDEADQLTNDSQMALRRPLEKYTKPIVILSCNEVNSLKKWIRSRLQEYEFKPIPKDKVIQRLEYIAEKEGLNTVNIEDIADRCDGDLRRAINILDNESEVVTTKKSELVDIWG